MKEIVGKGGWGWEWGEGVHFDEVNINFNCS